MPLFHDNVIDGALSVIATCNNAQVLNASSAVLVDTSIPALDSGNFGAIANNSSGGGRKIQCLVSQASDMKSIAVDSAGSATKVALRLSSATYVVASLPSTVTLGASDLVNLGTFSAAIKDPTT